LLRSFHSLLRNFNEQSPSFLKRGQGRFYGIAPIEKSPSIPLKKDIMEEETV
jgi:hypothetical protein